MSDASHGAGDAEAPRWSELPERGAPRLILLIRWIALRMGRRTSRLLLHPIAAYFVLAAPEARRASADFLSRLHRRPARLLEVYAHIHCFSATILDRVFLLTDRLDLFDVRIHGAEVFDEVLATGRGAVALGAHVGSYEALRTVGLRIGRVPLKALMNTDHNAVMMQVLDQLNPQFRDAVIEIGTPRTALEVREALDSGHIVATLADRVVSDGKAVVCELLGAPVRLPAGPLMIASAMRVPVVMLFALYRGGNRYDVHFELLSRRLCLRRAHRAEDLGVAAQAYADRLEHYLRLAPYNWFNFYDFWEVAGAQSASGPVVADHAAGGRKHPGEADPGNE